MEFSTSLCAPFSNLFINNITVSCFSCFLHQHYSCTIDPCCRMSPCLFIFIAIWLSDTSIFNYVFILFIAHEHLCCFRYLAGIGSLLMNTCFVSGILWTILLTHSFVPVPGCTYLWSLSQELGFVGHGICIFPVSQYRAVSLSSYIYSCLTGNICCQY